MSAKIKGIVGQMLSLCPSSDLFLDKIACLQLKVHYSTLRHKH